MTEADAIEHEVCASWPAQWFGTGPLGDLVARHFVRKARRKFARYKAGKKLSLGNRRL